MASKGRTSSHNPTGSLLAGVVAKETALSDLTERLQAEHDNAVTQLQAGHNRAVTYLQEGHERYVRSLRADLGEKIARLAQTNSEVETALEETRGYLSLALQINADVGDDNARLQGLLLEASEVSRRLEAALQGSRADKDTIADLKTELACKDGEIQRLQAEVVELTGQIAAQTSETQTLRQHNQTLARRLKRARGESEEVEPNPGPPVALRRSKWNFLRR